MSSGARDVQTRARSTMLPPPSDNAPGYLGAVLARVWAMEAPAHDWTLPDLPTLIAPPMTLP
jgi:hypothetical protein